jgi:hypothetical protein
MGSNFLVYFTQEYNGDDDKVGIGRAHWWIYHPSNYHDNEHEDYDDDYERENRLPIEGFWIMMDREGWKKVEQQIVVDKT